MRTRLFAAGLMASLLLSACSAKPSSAPPPPAPVPPAADGGGQSPTPATPAPPEPPPEPPKPVKRTIPTPQHGIMVSGWFAGTPELLEPLLTWAKGAGINTLVLDLKAEDGKISWKSDIPLAQEIGSNERKVGDLSKVVAQMHDMGFWVAGRIVTMNDQFLYRGRPSWGIPGFSGGAYSFMDPKNENVWRYNIDIAKEAVKNGVDEIQFDYIRYPEHQVEGYNGNTGPAYRTGNIDGFLKQAVSELKPMGVTVSADVFGLTTSVAEGDDMQIGQDYKQIVDIVDYVCAMVYPSHYAANTYGIKDPDKDPYDTVKQSMSKALERSKDVPVTKHRPWIQDFTYPAAGALRYGPAEITAQIKALHEIGIDSWTLWDPQNKYTRGLDYSKTPQ